MSMFAASALAALVAARAAADFQPCGPSSASCCNPLLWPPQRCPGGSDCQYCAGAIACECPARPSTEASRPSHKRIIVVNECRSEPIWIAHIAANAVGPDPQDVKIEPGESHRFSTSLNGGGLTATRFWPKMGCDEAGNNCSIGESGGPGEGCVQHLASGDDYSRCNPPVDSKFEGTFMPPGSPKGVKDTVDMSIVDGFTLPFKMEATGGECIRNGAVDPGLVDCSSLLMSRCPTTEAIHGTPFDLRAINPKTGKIAGCYSPCMRLTDDKFHKETSVAPDSPTAAPFCCAGAFQPPVTCKNGPITKTQYVTNAHSTCPHGYAYAYDDHRATISCTTDTEYRVTFYCPTANDDADLQTMFM